MKKDTFGPRIIFAILILKWKQHSISWPGRWLGPDPNSQHAKCWPFPGEVRTIPTGYLGSTWLCVLCMFSLSALPCSQSSESAAFIKRGHFWFGLIWLNWSYIASAEGLFFRIISNSYILHITQGKAFS